MLPISLKSVYGKTLENLRKRVKVRLVNNVKDYNKKWVSRPSFVSQIMISKILLLPTRLNQY